MLGYFSLFDPLFPKPGLINKHLTDDRRNGFDETDDNGNKNICGWSLWHIEEHVNKWLSSGTEITTRNQDILACFPESQYTLKYVKDGEWLVKQHVSSRQHRFVLQEHSSPCLWTHEDIHYMDVNVHVLELEYCINGWNDADQGVYDIYLFFIMAKHLSICLATDMYSVLSIIVIMMQYKMKYWHRIMHLLCSSTVMSEKKCCFFI